MSMQLYYGFTNFYEYVYFRLIIEPMLPEHFLYRLVLMISHKI